MTQHPVYVRFDVEADTRYEARELARYELAARQEYARESALLDFTFEDAPLGAIRELVNYNWDDEEEDYDNAVAVGDIEPDSERHIFTAIRQIDAWLKSQGA